MPDRPNEVEKKAAGDLVNSFAVLYPCSDCREDFKDAVKESPPEPHTGSRTEFATYMCEQHNIVNRKLAKVRGSEEPSDELKTQSQAAKPHVLVPSHKKHSLPNLTLYPIPFCDSIHSSQKEVKCDIKILDEMWRKVNKE